MNAAAAGAADRARSWEAVEGALLGALAGLLLQLLGLAEITSLDDGLVLPLAGSILGGALGAARGTRALVLATFPLLVVVLALAFVPWTGLTERWTRNDPLPPAPVDAVVALSSGLSGDSTLINGAVDRLLTGIELVRQGAAPRLITTLVTWWDGPVRISTTSDQRRFVHLAGLDSVWSVTDSVGVTRDEAVETARLLPGAGRSVIVVTSAAHTRRACATFEKVGFRVVCRAALERDRRTGRANAPEERLSVFRALLYEWLGMVKYRFEGWI